MKLSLVLTIVYCSVCILIEKQDLSNKSSGDMLAHSLDTTRPAVLNSRSLGTLYENEMSYSALKQCLRYIMFHQRRRTVNVNIFTYSFSASSHCRLSTACTAVTTAYRATGITFSHLIMQIRMQAFLSPCVLNACTVTVRKDVQYVIFVNSQYVLSMF